MTAQSKVNIAAAVSASLEPVNGGYKVILEGKKGKKIAVMSGDDDPAIYPSMAAAKKAVHRHNVALLNRVGLKPEI
jgi:hypothetical protein